MKNAEISITSLTSRVLASHNLVMVHGITLLRFSDLRSARETEHSQDMLEVVETDRTIQNRIVEERDLGKD